MTTIVFETATIADVIKKAERIAPAKSGHAFDKAAGMILDVYPDQDVKCVVRATNLDAFYTEIVGCVGAEGDTVRWRLPSQLLARVLGTLPIGSGKQVKFTQDGTRVIITADRLKATLVLMDPEYYPDWDMFDGTGMTTVSNLGARIAQVEWAASKHNDPPLCGVYLDGAYAIATDRYRLARTPCRVAIPRPIIVPSGILGSSLKAMGDTGIAVNGLTFQLAPDDYTQYQTVIFDMDFPPVAKVMKTAHPNRVKFRKPELIDKLNRVNQITASDRAPIVKVFLGKQQIAVLAIKEEIGLVGDVMDLPGQLDHDRIEVKFTPQFLVDGLSHAPNDEITVGYDASNPNEPIYIDGGSGYECWVVPRREIKPE